MKKSLSLKITFGIAGILLFVLGTVAWVSVSFFGHQYLQWVEARSVVLARPVQERIKDVMRVGYDPSLFFVLNTDMAALLKENAELSQIAVYDPSGKVLTHTDAAQAKSQAVDARVQKALEGRPEKPITVFFGASYHTLVPTIHDKATVYVSIGSRGDLIAGVQARIAWMFLLLTLASLVAGGAGALFLVRRCISRPINRLVALTKDIAEGEGDLTKRLDVQNRDEIGELAYWFNTFLDRL
ncbi:MAG TPA: HAMP domain-containing protein, partial [Candidatus Binatia bacterium]